MCQGINRHVLKKPHEQCNSPAKKSIIQHSLSVNLLRHIGFFNTCCSNDNWFGHRQFGAIPLANVSCIPAMILFHYSDLNQLLKDCQPQTALNDL